MSDRIDRSKENVINGYRHSIGMLAQRDKTYAATSL